MVSFKIDRELKNNLSVFGDEICISLSTMINSLLKKVERTKEFDLSVEEYYTPRPATIKIMEEAKADYLAGKTIKMTGDELTNKLKKIGKL